MPTPSTTFFYTQTAHDHNRLAIFSHELEHYLSQISQQQVNALLLSLLEYDLFSAITQCFGLFITISISYLHHRSHIEHEYSAGVILHKWLPYLIILMSIQLPYDLFEPTLTPTSYYRQRLSLQAKHTLTVNGSSHDNHSIASGYTYNDDLESYRDLLTASQNLLLLLVSLASVFLNYHSYADNRFNNATESTLRPNHRSDERAASSTVSIRAPDLLDRKKTLLHTLHQMKRMITKAGMLDGMITTRNPVTSTEHQIALIQANLICTILQDIPIIPIYLLTGQPGLNQYKQVYCLNELMAMIHQGDLKNPLTRQPIYSKQLLIASDYTALLNQLAINTEQTPKSTYP